MGRPRATYVPSYKGTIESAHTQKRAVRTQETVWAAIAREKTAGKRAAMQKNRALVKRECVLIERGLQPAL